MYTCPLKYFYNFHLVSKKNNSKRFKFAWYQRIFRGSLFTMHQACRSQHFQCFDLLPFSSPRGILRQVYFVSNKYKQHTSQCEQSVSGPVDQSALGIYFNLLDFVANYELRLDNLTIPVSLNIGWETSKTFRMTRWMGERKWTPKCCLRSWSNREGKVELCILWMA